ncbi:MAG: BLUF domain-containing protein [Salinarimonas sp.]
MAMTQLIYYSKNTLDADDRGQLTNLREILEIARRKNGENGVTGYLIFDKAYFLQILEGEKDAVEETYRRIAGDRRHADVTLVDQRAIVQRNFSDWNMGSAMRSVDHEEVYLAHGISGAIDPTKLDGAKILSLATDLRDLEARRNRSAA